jgi:hypothetical protein
MRPCFLCHPRPQLCQKGDPRPLHHSHSSRKQRGGLLPSYTSTRRRSSIWWRRTVVIPRSLAFCSVLQVQGQGNRSTTSTTSTRPRGQVAPRQASQPGVCQTWWRLQCSSSSLPLAVAVVLLCTVHRRGRGANCHGGKVYVSARICPGRIEWGEFTHSSEHCRRVYREDRIIARSRSSGIVRVRAQNLITLFRIDHEHHNLLS